MPSLSRPDRWTAADSPAAGPLSLRRHWTRAPSPSALSSPDRWAPVPPGRAKGPALERHWACGHGGVAGRVPLPTCEGYAETVTARERAETPSYRIAPPQPARTPPARPPAPAPPAEARLCIGCGLPLEGKRPQAKAHNVACRQRAYRRRKRDGGHNGRRSDGGELGAGEVAPAAMHTG